MLCVETARQFGFAGIDALSGTRIAPDCPALGVHFEKASVVHAEDVPVGLMPNRRVLRPSSLRSRSFRTKEPLSLYGSIEIFALEIITS